MAGAEVFASAVGFTSGIVALLGWMLFESLFCRGIVGCVCILFGLLWGVMSGVRATVLGIAGFLGVFFALGLYTAAKGPPDLTYAGIYVSTLTFFHFSEYFTTALFNPSKLSLDSFLLNHSKEYVAAAVLSWTEFILEYFLAPGLKLFYMISGIGVGLVVFGEVLRKVAMFTAASNFSHVIAYQKEKNHELVTHGVYAWFRHPSYVGWFYWSVGTQLLLLNPLSTVLYAVASWRFFKDRVDDEEMTLLLFFKKEYYDYQQRVGTGLPFIRGYQLTKKEIGELKIS